VPGEREFAIEDTLLAQGLRAYVVVPLIGKKRTLGTLNVGSFTAGSYSEADAECLNDVAQQVALALENMEAYDAGAGRLAAERGRRRRKDSPHMKPTTLEARMVSIPQLGGRILSDLQRRSGPGGRPRRGAVMRAKRASSWLG
jgi:GAF domain-containing protein